MHHLCFALILRALIRLLAELAHEENIKQLHAGAQVRRCAGAQVR